MIVQSKNLFTSLLSKSNIVTQLISRGSTLNFQLELDYDYWSFKSSTLLYLLLYVIVNTATSVYEKYSTRGMSSGKYSMSQSQVLYILRGTPKCYVFIHTSIGGTLNGIFYLTIVN